MTEQARGRGRRNEETTLFALLREGATAEGAGERLGRTGQAIYGRLQRFHKQHGRVSKKGGIFTQWPSDIGRHGADAIVVAGHLLSSRTVEGAFRRKYCQLGVTDPKY